MGKKNRKHRKPHSVLSSLKDLSADSRDTLSRLATTVRADMPTLMLGTAAGTGTVKTEGYAPYAQPQKPASRLSRFAKRLIPFAGQSAPRPSRETTRKVQHLANQMAMGNPKVKIRRSRLPLVVLMLCMMFAAGGYYAYQHVSLPTAKIAHYLDYKNWLGLASGQKPKHVESHAERAAEKVFRGDVVIGKGKVTYSKGAAHKLATKSKSSKASKSKVASKKAASKKHVAAKGKGKASSKKVAKLKSGKSSKFKKTVAKRK